MRSHKAWILIETQLNNTVLILSLGLIPRTLKYVTGKMKSCRLAVVHVSNQNVLTIFQKLVNDNANFKIVHVKISSSCLLYILHKFVFIYLV